ncbi:GNAT family N-acetyltransferase [Vibrio tritonius]|uniref:GNAT family N-acetyltransferase n=1 Tax=Vibrio tritonius TaxID=1435069 RepID=UPI00315D308D
MTTQYCEAQDKAYARQITQTNMAEYYRTHGINWDDEMFDDSWEHFENFDIVVDDIHVGVIRFSRSDNALYLRDLQVEAQYQNGGVGTQAIKWAKEYASQLGMAQLRLRVFPENPAKSLYMRLGFVLSHKMEVVEEMVFDLA